MDKVGTYKAIFKERILPHFPAAKGRFDKYFAESYSFISWLPLHVHPHYMSMHPHEKQNDETYSNKRYEIEFALCALGIKPLSVDFSHFDNEIIRNLLHAAGLEVVHKFQDYGPGGGIFDPVTCAPLLSKILNTKVMPEDVKSALDQATKIGGNWPHELLGYPEILPKQDEPKHQFTYESAGFLCYPSVYYFALGIWYGQSVMRMLEHLEGWAYATALVEDIRGTPASVITQSSVAPTKYCFGERGEGKTIEAIRIIRSDKPGDWKVSSEHETDLILEWNCHPRNALISFAKGHYDPISKQT